MSNSKDEGRGVISIRIQPYQNSTNIKIIYKLVPLDGLMKDLDC